MRIFSLAKSGSKTSRGRGNTLVASSRTVDTEAKLRHGAPSPTSEELQQYRTAIKEHMATMEEPHRCWAPQAPQQPLLRCFPAAEPAAAADEPAGANGADQRCLSETAKGSKAGGQVL
mmetsp:Transcript_23273/g.72501  ORF Transcript_23273/g.72501 Transcript_23273/m.72501 type:complete len:118 (-) Transcript_23273:6-359(-)